MLNAIEAYIAYVAQTTSFGGGRLGRVGGAPKPGAAYGL